MDSLSAKARGAAADQKLGRDPNGVVVFGGEMHCFVQLSKNENSMRKILSRNSDGWQRTFANASVSASRISTDGLVHMYFVLAGGSILQTSSADGRF